MGDRQGFQANSSRRDPIFKKRYVFFLFCVLILAVGAVYSNSLNGAFLFDDSHIVYRPNLHLTELSWDSIRGTFYYTPERNRIDRPVAGLSLGLNYYFGGLDPFGYHLVNVAIHIACVFAVYGFLLQVLAIPGAVPAGVASHSRTIAAIAALLFALHPIQTNVASYIIQRMTSLACLFYLLSFIGYLRFRRVGLVDTAAGASQRIAGVVLCMGSALLAVGSKENAAMLPILLLVGDWIFFYPLADAKQQNRLRWIYGAAIALLLILGIFAAWRYLPGFLAGYSSRPFTLTQRLLTEARIVFFYIVLLLVPSIDLLNFNHDVVISTSLWAPPQTLAAIVLLAALLVCAIWLRRRQRLLSFCIFWYFGNLAIESSIVPLELLFEHRTYLPGIAVFLLLAWAIMQLSRRIGEKPWWLPITMVLLVLYGHGTYLRNRVFQSPIALWEDVVAKAPRHARALSNLGRAYMQAGQPQKAGALYKTALEIEPERMEPLINLGLYLVRYTKRAQDGLELLQRAHRLYPHRIESYIGLGSAYLNLGFDQEAEQVFDIALKKLDFYPAVIAGLAAAQQRLGKWDACIATYRHGLRLDPSAEEYAVGLAQALISAKRVPEAKKELELFIQRNKNASKSKSLLLKLQNQP